MVQQEAVLIKVDRQTKERMKELNINWSEAIRQFIRFRLSKKKNLALAVALNDKILRHQKMHSTDTTEVIRRFREMRYGAGRS